MIDLFPGPEIVATRTHRDYEFTVGQRVLARTRQRSVGTTHWFTYVLRLLRSSSETRRMELEVLNPSDVPQLLLVLDPGRPGNFSVTATLTDGTPVGRATASGGMFSPFPEIELTDPTGVRRGHLTSTGAPVAYDAAGRQVAELIWLGARRPFDKPRWRLLFSYPDLPVQLRTLIVAGLIAWELPR